MLVFLLTFLLFILPYIIFPFGPSQFEMPKVFAAEIFIAITIIFVILKQGRQLINKINQYHLALTALLILLSIYQLFFLQTPFTFWGDPTRLQGILLLWHLLAFSLIVPYIPFKQFTYKWYAFILVSMFLLSLFIGNQNGRAVATIGEPNALAAFIIFLWPFLFFAKVKQTNHQLLIRTVSIFCTIGIIFLTGSRSGLLAFIVQMLFLFLVKVKRISPKLAVYLTLIIIAGTYILPFITNTLYENRADVWKTALIAGWQNTLFGGGFGNMEVILNKTTHMLHNSLIGYSIDSAHNILLDWWVQGGIIGVSLLLSFLVITIRNFYQEKRWFELTLLFGLFTALSFNPASVVSLVAFWWLIGRGFSTKQSNSNITL